jgi:hypothetical protein
MLADLAKRLHIPALSICDATWRFARSSYIAWGARVDLSGSGDRARINEHLSEEFRIPQGRKRARQIFLS